MISANAIKKQVFSNKEIHIEFEGVKIAITRFSCLEDEVEWEIPSHAHMNYEFHYIYEGTGKVELGNNVFDISAGEYYICPPFIDHSQKADAAHPMKEYCIECILDIETDEDMEKASPFLSRITSRLLYCKHSDRCRTIKKEFLLLHELFGENGKMDEGEELFAKSLFLNIILNMLIFSKSDTEINDSVQSRTNINYQRASSIKNYLEANYKNDISIKDCSHIFYLSERQIDRIMTKAYHVTFHEMLTNIRVNIAVNLMKTTDYSVDFVATEAGFSGYRQMLRSFKRFGIEQPTSIRKEYKL